MAKDFNNSLSLAFVEYNRISQIEQLQSIFKDTNLEI